MPKIQRKNGPFSWFMSKGQSVMIRIPVYDVQFMDEKTLDAIKKTSRRSIPNHLGMLGEEGKSRIIVDKEEGEEFAKAVFAMDEDAMELLRKAGGRFVRLESRPAFRNDTAAEARHEALIGLRQELGASPIPNPRAYDRFRSEPPRAPGLRAR